MKLLPQLRSSAASLIVASLLVFCCSSSQAADLTWSGAGGTANWSLGGNWGGTAPVAADNLIFSGTAQPVNTNDITGLASGWVRFVNGDFWLYGNTLTINGLTNVAGANVFYMPLTLGMPQNFDLAAGSSIAVSNTVTIGANSLTITGDGDVTLAGVVSGTGGGIIKTGNGILTLSAINTHTGGLTVNAGTVNANTGNNASYGVVGNGNLIINNGATVYALVDNTIFGQANAAPRTVTINTGGTLTTGDRSGHVPAIVLNGGTLSANTRRGDYGNWNLDYGVSTLGNGSYSYISGGNVTLGQAGGTVFNIGANDIVSVSSEIARTTYAGDLGLIKSGAGVLELSADNTYISSTVINNGTLRVSTATAITNTPTITVGANGTFDVGFTSFSLNTNQTLAGSGRVTGLMTDNSGSSYISPGGNGTAGTLAMENLTLSGNLSFKFDLANATTIGGVNDLLVVTNLTLSGGAANNIEFSFLSGSPLGGGVYTLIQYTTGPAAGPITTLTATASRYSYAFSSDGSSIKVTVTGTPASLVWKGDGTNNLWDIVTTPNWLKGGVPDLFYQADNVILNDVGSNAPSINIVAGVTPSTVTADAIKDYTLTGSGKITGSASLIKSNTGSLLLLTDNDQTGPTRIEGGTVFVGNGGTSGSPGAGNITNNASLILNRSDSLTIPGTISGSGKIAKLGAGTITTLAAHPFTGSLTISNGAMQLGNITAGAAGFQGSITNYGLLGVRGTNNVILPGPVVGTSGVQLFGTNTVRFNSVNLIGTSALEVGNNNGTAGRPTLSVGSGDNVTVGRVFVGQTASYNGNVTQTGGLLNITDVTESEGPFRLGHWPTETSTYDMSGGLLVVTGAPNARISLGIDGTGVWNMSGGTAMVSRIDINGRSATGSGNLNLTNGTIMVGSGGVNGFAPYTNNLAGGTLGALANWTGALTNTLNGAVTFDSGPYAITLSGPFVGAGSITKLGTGILALNGASSSTGALNVQAGTLQGSGSFAGPITLQPAVTLSAGGTLGTGTLTVSNIAFSPGAKLVLDLSSTAATSDTLAARGTLAFDAGTPVTFNFLGGTPYAAGPYTIVTNWVPRSGSLTYVNPTRYAVNLDETHPNRIQVTFSGSNAGLVWKGNVNNLWNLNADANWLNGNVASTYFQSDAVVFDNNGISAPSVSLAAEMNPARVTVNSSGDYAFSGAAINTVGNLIKSGAGTLTLGNNNNLSGGLVINAGTVQVGNGGTAGSITGNVGNYASLIFNRSDAHTYAGVISGPGAFTQAGSGTLLLTGNSVSFGTATINPGTTVQVGNGVAVDSGSLGNGLVNNLGSIVYNRAGSVPIAAPHTGPGALTFLGTGIIGQSSYSLNATNTFTGPVTLSNARLIGNVGGLSLGSPSSVNIQQGSQIYAIASTFSPQFNIPVTVSGSGWLENAGLLGALRLQNGANWAGPVTLAGTTRISAWSDALSNVISGTITGPYDLELGINAAGFISLAPSAPNSFNSLRVSPGTVWLDNANALPSNIPLIINGGTLKLNGQNVSVTDIGSPVAGIIQNGSSTTPATLTLNPASDALYTGTFVNGGSQTLALVKNGKSALALSGLNSASGGVTVNGGVLALRAGGGNGAIRGTVTMQPGTVLLSQNNDSFGYNGGAAQVTNLNLNGASLIHTPGNNLTLWQNLVVNMTAGYIAATNTGGRIDFGTGASLNTLASANSSVIAGVNLYMRQANTIITVADGAAVDDLLVTAPINQAAAGYGITKNGDGRMKVMNAFGLSGALAINGGSLVLGSASSTLTNTGTISLGTGTTLDASVPGGLNMGANQTLQGSGTVLGSVTDGTTSVISPGAGVGTLTVGGLTLGSGGKLIFDLNSTSTTTGGGVNDLIQVTGALSLNDSAPTPVDFSFLNGLNAAGTYTIITCGSISGTAAGLTNKQGYPVTFSIVGNAVRATFTAAPGQSLVWQGGDMAGNIWNAAVPNINWLNGVVPTNFNQLDSVTFNDTTANTIVDITADVQPSSITIDGAANYQITSAAGVKMTGTASITKNGTGTTTLDIDPNLSAGPINVNGGILTYGTRNNSYAGATTITVANGAAFDFGGDWDLTQTQPHTFVVQGSGPDGLGAVRASGADILSYTFITNFTLAGDTVIGGAFRWDIGPMTNSKVDGGGFKLTKTGVNGIGFRPQILTNLAALIVTNGRLWYENYDRTNSWEANITNYASSGGRLGVYGGRTINMPVVLDSGELYSEGGGTPVWTGPIRVDNGSLLNNGGAQNIYGPISGPGALWVNGGTAVLTVTNANTFAGGTVISNGPVTTAAANATAGSAAVIMADPSALGTGPITINGSAYPSLTTNASFFLTNVFRAVEFAFGTQGTVGNAIVLPSATVNNASLHGRDNTRVVNLTGTISGGFTGFTNWIDFGAAGNGVLRYANTANTFLGTVTVFRGILGITADGSLGNSANLVRLNSGTLRFDAPSINLAHGIFATAAGSTLHLLGDNNGDGTLDTANSVTISGVISGGTAFNVRGTNGVLTLSGNNTMTSGYELLEPVTLQVGAGANLGTAAAYVALKGGSTFRYTGSGAETWTRNLWNDNAALGGGTIDILNASANLTWNPGGGTCNQSLTKTGAGTLAYGGVISGTAIVNLNAGTLALGGANTYVGPTFVNSGTLFVNGSLPAANAVIVASGATLGGTGTINCPVDMQAGSLLKPGVNGIGTLNIVSPLALSASTATTMEIDGSAGTSDRIASLSTVTYGGTLTVTNISSPVEPAVGTKFTLFSAVDRLGSFSSVTLPTLTAPRYWTNMLAIDGSITVLSSVNTTPTNIVVTPGPGNITLSWPSDYLGWRLEAQTNAIATGLSNNWVTVPGSTSTTSVVVPLDPANPTVFYRLIYP